MATNTQPIAVIARLLDLTERRVQQLARDGIIPASARTGPERGRYDLVGTVRGYARAAAWIAGADRWGEQKWRDLERQVGSLDPSNTVGPETTASDPGTPEIASAGLVRRAPARRGRRVFTPSYLS
jgi:hypothetical protein